MDRITLSGMVFYGHHGFTEVERNLGSTLRVDCELWKDLKPAGVSDNLRKSVDARDIYRLISSIVLEKKFHTLEALAQNISDEILKTFTLEKVVVRVRKPNPPEVGVTDYLEVEVERRV